MAETEFVWLSHLKFANLRAVPDPASKKDVSNLSAILHHVLRLNILCMQYKPWQDIGAKPNLTQLPTTSVSTAKPKPHERLANDKPGEELAPDAGIWQLYLDEARDYDNELVEGKNKNLDTMLLFVCTLPIVSAPSVHVLNHRLPQAGLFSAVLTTFLIESKKLLQEDPADISATLLLSIAQSQQRVEQSNAQALPPVEKPPFLVPMSARWINGLWFTALALSLAAALIAMLAKEWLTAFTASRPRPPHRFALLHQARLQGLRQWRALHIIDLLPSMIHLSLLLFSLGLAVYLWTLDPGIAAVVGVISGTTLLFYLSTTLLGAAQKHCPFVTQISQHIENFLETQFENWGISRNHLNREDHHSEEYTTEEELHALLWLAKYARDPAVGDCSYQALAGLRLRPLNAPTSADNFVVVDDLEAETIEVNEDEGGGDGRDGNEMSELGKGRHDLLNSLFKVVCTRLSQALSLEPRELAACQGVNVSRYASALPTLVTSLEAHLRLRPPGSHDNNFPTTPDVGEQATCSIAQNVNLYAIIMFQESETPAHSAFHALDSIWSDDCPEFSPDSYAVLTAAEFRLIEAAAVAHHSLKCAVPAPSHARLQLPNEGETVISVAPAETTTSKSAVSLFDLRARYSRATARAAFLLSFHSSGGAPISTYALIHLLESILLVSRCTHINPKPQTITDSSQLKDKNALSTFCVRAFGTNVWYFWCPSDIGDEDGLLAGLIAILSSPGIEETPIVELAAGRALSAILPIQWLNMKGKDELRGGQPEKMAASIQKIVEFWPEDLEKTELDLQAKWTIKQLICVATIAVSQAGISPGDRFPDIAVAALYRRAKAASGRIPACQAMEDANYLVQLLVEFTEDYRESLSEATRSSLVRLFLIKYRDITLFRQGMIQPASLSIFLGLLAQAPGYLSELQQLLSDLEQLLQNGAKKPWSDQPLMLDYLSIFTSKGEGFSTLVRIGQHDEYYSAISVCIVAVIRVAAERTTIIAPALPRLLKAVIFVLRGLLSHKTIIADLESFMENTVKLLRTIEDDEPIIHVDHATKAEIEDALSNASNSAETRARILAQWEEIRDWMDADAWLLRGIDTLFDT
jgi:hypothetical protein